jgi:hypothetical protein
MQVGAVEHQLGVLVGRQFVGDVIMIVGAERPRTRDHAGAPAERVVIRVVDADVGGGIVHQRHQIGDPMSVADADAANIATDAAQMASDNRRRTMIFIAGAVQTRNLQE